ncbi:two-component system cell cycle response regulator DivK [Methanohalophilus levihalophilus]|uniref:response regulator n=1 Tax=Methanohalophilus levihalophilus TaxID=1431282 RepID=UPI001AE5F4E7|nr:response regulator [Methanohalophilus levihalophilus]MBP2030168.1 two-component system cell cycle response regulator DivK [Methanohalophilus levihalophilus]
MVTILVVEDNPMNMELTVDLLEADGYDVEQAEDGPMALSLIKDKKVDLILLDMQLPKMDGLEVLSRLKNSEETKDVPVVALTAHSMRGDEGKFINAGCNGYISKPIDIHEFRKTVAGYVSNK